MLTMSLRNAAGMSVWPNRFMPQQPRRPPRFTISSSLIAHECSKPELTANMRSFREGGIDGGLSDLFIAPPLKSLPP